MTDAPDDHEVCFLLNNILCRNNLSNAIYNQTLPHVLTNKLYIQHTEHVVRVLCNSYQLYSSAISVVHAVFYCDFNHGELSTSYTCGWRRNSNSMAVSKARCHWLWMTQARTHLPVVPMKSRHTMDHGEAPIRSHCNQMLPQFDKMSQKSLFSFGFGASSQSSSTSSQSKRKSESDQRESKVLYDRTKLKRDYQTSWEEKFPGLMDSAKGMVCNICMKYNQGGDSKFLTGITSYRLENIKAHWSSPKQILCCQAEARENADDRGPLERILLKLGDQNKLVLEHMFNTVISFWRWKCHSHHSHHWSVFRLKMTVTWVDFWAITMTKHVSGWRNI